MKKVITTLMVVISSLIPLATKAQVFSDVSYNHPYYPAIEYWSDLEVIQGYQDGRFKPEKTISREEAVKLIELSIDEEKPINNPFQIFYDVPLEKWSSPYIYQSYINGNIEGYSGQLFKPKRKVSFSEALKVILEAHEIKVVDFYDIDLPLIESEIGDWHYPYFLYAYENKLINSNKSYHPHQKITRGEFSDVLYRLKQLMNEEELDEFIIDQSNEYTITIPKLKIFNLPVNFADLYNQKQALGVLKNGLGHYLSTPDKKEKMIIFGHSSGYNWDHSKYKQVLKEIDQLNNGDKIYINYHEKGYAYEVMKKNILPAYQLEQILNPSHEPNHLTLYTCWPPNQISHRYIVYAKPISS